MKLARLLLLVAISVNVVCAATISSGLATVEGFLPRGPFTLTGENSLSFILSGSIGDGNFPALGVYIPSGEEASLDLGGITVGNDVHITSAIVNGVPRPELFFRALLEFTSETVTVNGVGLYTAPFTFSGLFGGYDTQEFENCLICPPGGNDIPIFGRGVVTLEVVPDVPELSRTHSLTYQFIPEPGTLWLLLSGGVLALARRIIRAQQLRAGGS